MLDEEDAVGVVGVVIVIMMMVVVVVMVVVNHSGTWLNGIGADIGNTFVSRIDCAMMWWEAEAGVGCVLACLILYKWFREARKLMSRCCNKLRASTQKILSGIHDLTGRETDFPL